MAFSSRRRRFVHAPQPRKKVWARTDINLTITGGLTSTATLLSNFEAAYSADLLGCTIMRIRGCLMGRDTILPAVNTGLRTKLSWGIVVVNGNQLAGTSANWPDPDANATGGAYADWMGFGCMELFTSGGGTIPTDDGAHWQREEIDIKAMRRLDELGDTLAIFASGTSSTLALSGPLSMLIALP